MRQTRGDVFSGFWDAGLFVPWGCNCKTPADEPAGVYRSFWWRGQDSNLRPLGYEPNELPLLHPALFLSPCAPCVARWRVESCVNPCRSEASLSDKPECGPSPRSISTAQLRRLLALHLRPIYPVVSRGPYSQPKLHLGNLILELASRLDAFSAYRIQTWLPGGAAGATTGTPEVCPSRSSRTRESSPQISYAHGG